MFIKRRMDENSGYTMDYYYPELQFIELGRHESTWKSLRKLTLSEKHKLHSVTGQWTRTDANVFLKMYRKEKHQIQESGYPLTNGITGHTMSFNQKTSSLKAT